MSKSSYILTHFINTFYQKSVKSKNGSINSIRESIIYNCMNNKITNEYLKVDRWNHIYTNIRSCIISYYDLYNKTYAFESAGGRNNNYDFKLIVYKDESMTNIDMEYKIEFKFNQSLYKMPQIGQWSKPCNYFKNNVSYVEMYYDNYFRDSMIEHNKKNSSLHIIEKEEYLKYIYQCNNKIFKPYKEYYKNLSSLFNIECKKNVDKCTKLYLEQNEIDITKFDEIFNISLNKDYLFYNLNNHNFEIKKFVKDDFIIEKLLHIKNNRIEYLTKSNKMLILRIDWKNNKGICNPCIKLVIKNISFKNKNKK